VALKHQDAPGRACHKHKTQQLRQQALSGKNRCCMSPAWGPLIMPTAAATVWNLLAALGDTTDLTHDFTHKRTPDHRSRSKHDTPTNHTHTEPHTGTRSCCSAGRTLKRLCLRRSQSVLTCGEGSKATPFICTWWQAGRHTALALLGAWRTARYSGRLPQGVGSSGAMTHCNPTLLEPARDMLCARPSVSLKRCPSKPKTYPGETHAHAPSVAVATRISSQHSDNDKHTTKTRTSR
jgi:hypothetical protein